MGMQASRSPARTQDGLILASILRGAFLFGLPLLAGYAGILTRPLILLLGIWALLTLALSLAQLGDWPDGQGLGIITTLDLAFGSITVLISGYLQSPLWASLLVAPVGVGLRMGVWGGLAIGTVVALLSALLGTAAQGDPMLALVGAPAFALGVLPFAALLTSQGHAALDRLRESSAAKLAEVERARAEERRRAHELFRMAAEINASLDINTVVDQALELCSRALGANGGEPYRLASALVILTKQGFRIFAARNLEIEPTALVFSTQGGALSRALVRGDVHTVLYPENDPELSQIPQLEGHAEVLIAPLAHGLETYGLLFFCHPTPRFFDRDRQELLASIAQQVTIALQNAHLYEDLAAEKERISELQEEARKKLARDLHDGPTQTMAAITMRVNHARRLMGRDREQAAQELTRIEDMARQTTREIRHMLFTLRPLILESQGLAAALYQLSEKMRETHHQRVLLDLNPDLVDELDMAKQGVIFYVAEEAINNARKHAAAEHIWVRLRREGDTCLLEVEDDGVGFNVGAVDSDYAQRGSLGMVTMRERAELVNGSLHIESAEGKGTCIRLSVPC